MELSILAMICFSLSLLGTGLALKILRKNQVYDIPRQRSNHKIPTPTSGGIIFISIIILSLIYAQISILPICLAVLAIVSIIDDIKNLSAWVRFTVHIFIVTIGINFLFPEGAAFKSVLPYWPDVILTGFIWLWFLNLYNFMDGIDGITASETLAICLGIFLVSYFGVAENFHIIPVVIIFASVLGFAFWNRHPAKIFMGDAGSVPLGFLLAYLLLKMASEGLWVIAIILPSYYLADSGITLLKRLIKGKKIWQAHSEHFYQQAVRSGKNHSDVVKIISAGNIFLVAIALMVALKIINVWLALLSAAIVVSTIIFFLKYRRRY